MKFSTQSKILAFTACVAMLSACGGATDEQDGVVAPLNAPPETTNTQVAVGGQALNGYLANALVWIDSRNNNTPDGFESFAYTDSEGFFSYNPNTGVNYCESSVENLQQFCLKTGAQSGTLVIKVANGLELLNGEPFRAILSAQTTVEDARNILQTLTNIGAKPTGDVSLWQQQVDASQLYLSPLSSVAYHLDNTVQTSMGLKQVLSNLGFTLSADSTDQSILQMNYIEALAGNNADAQTLFLAENTIARVVDLLTVNIDAAAIDVEFGIDGLAINSANDVYETLVARLVSLNTFTNNTRTLTSNGSYTSVRKQSVMQNLFDDTLGDAISKLQATLLSVDLSSSRVQARLNALKDNKNVAKIADNLNSAALTFLQNNAGAVSASKEDFTLFSLILSLPTLSDPIAYETPREVLAIMTIANLIEKDNALMQSFLNTFSQGQSQSELNALNIDLQALTNDLRALIEDDSLIQSALGNINQNDVDINDINFAGDIVNNKKDQVSVITLAELSSQNGQSPWAGKRLSLSGVNDETEQGQIVAFFVGDATATNVSSGELVMCVAYKNSEDAKDNIDGKRFDGTWSVLGGDSQNRMSLVSQGFNVQMKVLGESSGREIPSDQQVPSIPRMPNEVYGKFGFSLNQDSATWHSDHASVNGDFGLRNSDSVPTTDQDCAAVLNLHD